MKPPPFSESEREHGPCPGLPGTGKLGYSRADPKPQMCHLRGYGECLACGGLLGMGQGHGVEHQGVPASALTTHSRAGGSQEAMRAIKVFVKKLSWALWAILMALFRLAVSGKKKKKRQCLEANQS